MGDKASLRNEQRVGIMQTGEKRWQHWAAIVSDFLEWPECTGMPWEYIVCDRRDSGGNLEMAHIAGHTAKSIRKQVAEIVRKRK